MLVAAVAKATCRSAIRAARGLVDDLGVNLARRSPGIVEISKCSESNSERDMHNTLDKFGLGLEIPLTPLHLSDQKKDIPVLRLRDWAAYLLRFNVWHLVCGLMAPNEQREKAVLRSFWHKFRCQNPRHPIFELAAEGKICLDRVAPCVLHGDEGRGQKRQPFLVCNYHSLLGRGTNLQKQRNGQMNLRRRFVQHNLNFKGHSYTHRFLFGCMPKAFFADDNEEVFTAFLGLAAEEASHMAVEGAMHPRTGERHWFMTLGVTGDWPWLQRSGDLSRTFSHVQKKRNLRHPPVGICHLCKAGQNGIPFEQFQTRRPIWYNTLFQQCPFNSPSPFLAVPHVADEFPSFFKFDVFHVWHLGLAKQFLGGALALLSEIQPAGNIDQRFELLTQEFLGWCQLHKKTPQVKKLSKELISWPTQGTFPVGAWHKGALTTVLMEFVEDHYKDVDFSANGLLQECMEAVRAGNACLRTLFSRGVFLSNSDAGFAGEMGMKFLRRFASLAHRCRILGRMLFPLQPKGHAFHHIVLELVLAASRDNRSHIVNPLAWSCQADEDFVGRPSRVSRRVRPGKIQVRRVIQRYLKGAYRHWIKSKLVCRAART